MLCIIFYHDQMIIPLWTTVITCLIWHLTHYQFFAFKAPYVKVYLLHNGAYVAKKKTKIARKTLDPLYQQTLQFEESPHGKVLQVSHVVFLYVLYNEFTSILWDLIQWSGSWSRLDISFVPKCHRAFKGCMMMTNK